MPQLIVATRSHGAPRIRESFVQPGLRSAIARAQRTSLGWTMVVRVALAIGIIVGILAMHSFLSPDPQTNATMAGAISEASAQPEVSAALHHVVAASAVVTSGVANFAKDCLGCAGDLSMATMLCILALFTIALMLIAPRLLGRWQRQLWRLLHRLFSPSARYLAVVLPPPSLNALGISRT